MAVLKQSSVWPIRQARQLHAQAQLQYMWRFHIPNADGVLDEDIAMLAQSVTFPMPDITYETYQVGQAEKHVPGDIRRGGTVNAVFIETDGGKVEGFFRTWFDEVDIPAEDTAEPSRGRAPIAEFARTAYVYMLPRESVASFTEAKYKFQLIRLMPVRMGPYQSLTYDGVGLVTLPVEMVCDEVRRA